MGYLCNFSKLKLTLQSRFRRRVTYQSYMHLVRKKWWISQKKIDVNSFQTLQFLFEVSYLFKEIFNSVYFDGLFVMALINVLSCFCKCYLRY